MTMQKVAEALAYTLKMARYEVDRLAKSPSSHQEFLREDRESMAQAEEALAFVCALLRSDAQGERGGWRLVPVEPTEAMLHASTMEVPTWDRDASLRKWRAMLAAAPSTPSASEIATPALPSESKDSGVTARRDGTPSPSDWEAGAEAMREACAKWHKDQSRALCKPDGSTHSVKSIWHLDCSETISALQIPRRP